jgi:hypothetical protein
MKHPNAVEIFQTGENLARKPFDRVRAKLALLPDTSTD